MLLYALLPNDAPALHHCSRCQYRHHHAISTVDMDNKITFTYCIHKKNRICICIDKCKCITFIFVVVVVLSVQIFKCLIKTDDKINHN